MNNKYIPIVFATDDGYAMPTAVAITSLIKNKNAITKYKCYIITPGLSEYHKNRIESLNRKDCIIEIICNREILQDYEANLKKVTNTDYYRLMLDSLINEDKVIALDGDLLVLEDLNDLYNIDLENNLIGGCYFRPHDIYNREYVQNTLLLNEGQRINIGVMVMDLKKIRENNLQPIFLQHIGKFKVMSEDIINFVCKNKIKYLPIKWNYNLHFYKYQKLLNNCPVYSQQEYKKAKKHPAIFHYTLEKPWKSLNVNNKRLWLKYKKDSPYKNEKLNVNHIFVEVKNQRFIIDLVFIKIKIKI